MESISKNIVLKNNELNKYEYFILVKERTGYFIIQPLIDKTKKIYEFKDYSILKVFYESKTIIGIKKGIVLFYTYKFCKKENKLLLNCIQELDKFENVCSYELSSKFNYLTIIQHPSIKDNLKLLKIYYSNYDNIIEYKNNFTYEIVYSCKSTLNPSNGYWPQIRLNSQENLIMKKINEDLEIVSMEIPEHKYCIKKVYDLALCNFISENELLEYIVLVREKSSINKKNPKKIITNTVISIYTIKDIFLYFKNNFNISTSIKDNKSNDNQSNNAELKFYFETAVSQMTRTTITLSKNNNYCLISSICDQSTSTSYYGSSILYYVNIPKKNIKKLTQLKEGPILDYNFSIDNTKFYIVCGHQPCSVYSFDTSNGNYISEIANEFKVNNMRLSNNGKLMCLFGYGNLPGDICSLNVESNNKTNSKNINNLVGISNVFGSREVEYSQDSKLLLTSVISPYLNIDNDFKVHLYNCELVDSYMFEYSIYMCKWLYIYNSFDIKEMNNSNKYDNYKIVVSNSVNEYNNKKTKNTLNQSINKPNNQNKAIKSNKQSNELIKPVFFNSNK